MLLQKMHESLPGKFASFRKIDPRRKQTEFCIAHYAADVSYNINGFLGRNRSAISPDLVAAMETSTVRSMDAGGIADASCWCGGLNETPPLTPLQDPFVGSLFDTLNASSERGSNSALPIPVPLGSSDGNFRTSSPPSSLSPLHSKVRERNLHAPCATFLTKNTHGCGVRVNRSSRTAPTMPSPCGGHRESASRS